MMETDDDDARARASRAGSRVRDGCGAESARGEGGSDGRFYVASRARQRRVVRAKSVARERGFALDVVAY